MNETEHEALIALAKQGHPNTSAAELGFEARLMARLRSGRYGSDDFAEVFSSWLWRSALGLSPVVATVAVLFVLSYGLSIPQEAHDFAGHLASWLPVSPF